MAISRTALGTSATKDGTTKVNLTGGVLSGQVFLVLLAADSSRVGSNITRLYYGSGDYTGNASPDVSALNAGNVNAHIIRLVASKDKAWDGTYPYISDSGAEAVAIAVIRVAGLASTPLDKYNPGTGNGADASSGSSGTLSQADEIVVCVAGWEGPNGDSTNSWSGSTPSDINAGQSIGTTGGGAAGNIKVDEGYKIVASTSACTGVSHNSTASRDWACAIATYKGAAAGTLKTLTATASGTASRTRQVKLKRIVTSTVTASRTRIVYLRRIVTATGGAVKRSLVSLKRIATVTGTATLVASRLFVKSLQATASGAASLRRAISFIRSVMATGIAQRSRRVSMLRSAVASGGASIARSIRLVRSVGAAGVAALRRGFLRTLIASGVGTATLSKIKTGVLKLLTATADGTASILRTIKLTRTGTASGAATLSKLFPRTLQALAGGSAALIRSILLRRAAGASGTAVIVRVRSLLRSLVATASGAASLARLRPLLLTAVAVANATVRRRLNRILVAVSSVLASMTRWRPGFVTPTLMRTFVVPFEGRTLVVKVETRTLYVAPRPGTGLVAEENS